MSAQGPQPAADLLARLRAVDTCAVSDALDALGLPGAVLGLRCVTGSHRIAGRAVTVDLVEIGRTETSSRHLGTAAVDASSTGDVIVVAHGGRVTMSGWGGVLAAGAARNGVEGVVVDGAVRDVDEAADLGLPVFAVTGVPVTARGRVVERAWNVEVVLRGVTVRPGDFVLADGSGVVVVPAAEVEPVLAKAEAVVAKEQAMVAKVREGLPMVDVMGADYENLLKG
ncbi:4-carboxy-4-hydroxy-2-oxoadipate aldolase/oxaloacetate decarboxylase [Pseudonocardia sp. NPDC049635]|uniref:RraA family protein n=1 Tax=Pseudonocardia sp. NPDC049635 TaxID=3155506 RepID=UPI0033CD16E1